MQNMNGYAPSVRYITFEYDVFDVNVTFASNIFKVRLLVKVILLIEMSLSITTVKQLVLV